MTVAILRFSAVGDVLQTLSAANALLEAQPKAKLIYVTKKPLVELLRVQSFIDEVLILPSKASLEDLKAISHRLLELNVTHIFDAHNNLRSRLICWHLKRHNSKVKVIRKPNRRFQRFLLFWLRSGRFEWQTGAQKSFLETLSPWTNQRNLWPLPKNKRFLNAPSQTFSEESSDPPTIAIAPSASYALKRWPLEHWESLIAAFPERQFALLCGPHDQFLDPLKRFSNVQDLSQTNSWSVSAQIVQNAALVVSNDTGVLHLAEQLNVPTIALMGPAPLGYPSRKTTRVLELPLACRPCSKHGQGPCHNFEHQACLVRIRPETVIQLTREMLAE